MQNRTQASQEHLIRDLTNWIGKKGGLVDSEDLKRFFETSPVYANTSHMRKPIELARAYPVLFKIVSNKFGAQYLTLLTDDNFMCQWLDDTIKQKGGEIRGRPTYVIGSSSFVFMVSDIQHVAKRNPHRFDVTETSTEEVCIKRASSLRDTAASPTSTGSDGENNENMNNNNFTNNGCNKSSMDDGNCEAIAAFVSWLKSRGGWAWFEDIAELSAANAHVAKTIRSMGLKKFLRRHSCLSLVEGKDLVILVDAREQALQDMISFLESQGGTISTGAMTSFYEKYGRLAEYIRRIGVQCFLRLNPTHFEVNRTEFRLRTRQSMSNGPSAPVKQSSSPSTSTARPSLSCIAKSPFKNNRSTTNQRELLDKSRPPTIRPTSLSEKSRAAKDKNGIHIEPRVIEVSSSGFIPQLPVQITVECDPASVGHMVSGVSLHDVVIFDPRKNAPATQMRLQRDTPLLPLNMFPSTKYKVSVEWSPGCPNGRIQIHVAEVQFIFFSEVRGWFSISRFIALDAGGEEVVPSNMVNSIRPESEYFRKKAPTPLVFSSTPSYPRVDDKPSLLPIQLPRIELDRNPDVSILEEEFVTLENYLPRFQTLLHLNAGSEAAVLEQSVIRSQKPRVRAEYKNVLWFNMDGLGERRPSVLPRDKAKIEVEGMSRTIGGVVRYVEAKQIGIFLNPRDFEMLVSRYVNVGFAPDLFSFKMMHYALGNAVRSGLVERLFDYNCPLPECSQEIAKASLTVLKSMQCFTRLNEFQQEAIKTITTKMPPNRRQPFLLFGPPGTGKTTTLVAAVACLLRLNRKRARVLISAPSNTACDVFRDKLKRTLNEMKMNIKIARVMSSVLADKNQPEPEDVVEAQVVIATCVTSGRLESLPGYFSHVFVDEAGQCTEPEVLIPLGFSGKTGQIVLGGDHKQLGPVILDKVASGKGHFDISMFESLMLSKEYDPLRSSNNDFCRMLRLNYRSHEHLVKVPSDLFYGGRLIAGASKSRESLTKWRHLPSRGVPLVLHHVKGKEDREGNSPSWFNVAECVQVVEYIKKLMTTFVAEEEIAVIAPYQGQVRKLRRLLTQVGFTKCRVDTVEKLQGDEARVTIVSTCRSSSMNDDYDAMYHVGFLKNEKRMNVAITRAKELLIVVGNLEVLKNDQHWKGLVDYAQEHGATVDY